MHLNRIFGCLLIVFLINQLYGQRFQMQEPPGEKSRIDLTYMHPSFESEIDLSLLSGVYQLDMAFPVSKKINILIGIPFSTWSFEDSDNEQGFGNMFAGVQTRSPDTTGLRSSGTFGLFLPTASEDNEVSNLYSLLTQFQHGHRYIPNRLTLMLNVSWAAEKPNGAFYGFEIGTRFWIPTKSEKEDIEFIINYGAAGGVRFDPVALSIELAGQILLSQESDSFSDKITHTLSFGLSWIRGEFNPSVFYSIYLKDYLSDTVTGVLGVRLKYTLP